MPVFWRAATASFIRLLHVERLILFRLIVSLLKAPRLYVRSPGTARGGKKTNKTAVVDSCVVISPHELRSTALFDLDISR